MYCLKCGTRNGPSAVFCMNCGSDLTLAPGEIEGPMAPVTTAPPPAQAPQDGPRVKPSTEGNPTRLLSSEARPEVASSATSNSPAKPPRPEGIGGATPERHLPTGSTGQRAEALLNSWRLKAPANDPTAGGSRPAVHLQAASADEPEGDGLGAVRAVAAAFGVIGWITLIVGGLGILLLWGQLSSAIGGRGGPNATAIIAVLTSAATLILVALGPFWLWGMLRSLTALNAQNERLLRAISELRRDLKKAPEELW